MKYPLINIKLCCTIDPILLRRLQIYTAVAKTEISAIGEVHGSVDGTLHVQEPIHFVKQRNSSVSTHLDMHDLALTIEEKYLVSEKHALCRGSCDCLNNLKFWFHTHPSSVFFSPTDLATIKKLSDYMTPFVVAAVFNDQGESRWTVFRDGNVVLEWAVDFGAVDATKEELRTARLELSAVVQKEAWSFSRRAPYKREKKVCDACGTSNDWWRGRCEKCYVLLDGQDSKVSI